MSEGRCIRFSVADRRTGAWRHVTKNLDADLLAELCASKTPISLMCQTFGPQFDGRAMVWELRSNC